MKKTQPQASQATQADMPAAALIDARIAELGDWRGEMLAQLRAVVLAADDEVVEEWKWSVPVWSRDGILCTGEVYKAAVKMTFPKGASLDDPKGLFNASLEGNARRAIDFHEGARIDKTGLKALIRAAIAANQAAVQARQSKARSKSAKA